jgi:peptidoglycan hydrolase-like protein with peptidoglycan-binding domain
VEQIRKVQQKLNQEGFHAGQVDGKWSSETQSAIRNFQQSKGMKATGQLDERTLDELGLEADEFRQKSQSGSGKAESRGSGSTGTKR